MKNILLPTDFSENSWNAIKYALQLFQNDECIFYVLNTYTPIIYQVDYMDVSAAQFGLVDAVKETSLEGLKTIEKRIKDEFKNSRHTIETISSFNTLIPEIKEVVDRNNIEMVIMGTQGSSGIKEVLFGSNTVHVFKNIKTPVLAVPADFVFEPLHEVLFPTDYEIDYEKQHIDLILDLAKVYNSRINVLHVRNVYDLSENQKTNKNKLETFFKPVANLFHDVENKNIDDAINEFQLQARINLLIMINNKHSFFENLFFKSTINQIGFHLNIPFLVIPSK